MTETEAGSDDDETQNRLFTTCIIPPPPASVLAAVFFQLILGLPVSCLHPLVVEDDFRYK